jgi:hypothetical protein
VTTWADVRGGHVTDKHGFGSKTTPLCDAAGQDGLRLDDVLHLLFLRYTALHHPDMSRSLTYAEMAEALKITPESANRLARRKRWQRAKGNDGRTPVAVPEEAPVRQDSPPVSPTDSPTASPPDKLIKALEAHVETLKPQLAAAEARIDKQADDMVAYDTAYAAGWPPSGRRPRG